MFVHKELVELEEEVAKQKKKIEEQDKAIWILEREKELDGKLEEMNIEKTRAEIRKQMQKDLIESDLRRVKAEAMYDAYVKMDTKDERKHIRNMLEKAITSLGNKVAVEVVK